MSRLRILVASLSATLALVVTPVAIGSEAQAAPVVQAQVQPATAPLPQAAARCSYQKVERWWGTYGEARCSGSFVAFYAVVLCKNGGGENGDRVRPGKMSSGLCWFDVPKSISAKIIY